jgi:hypothetical protein
VDLVPSTIFRSVRRVVVEGDDLLATLGGNIPCVMLEGEFDLGTKSEVRVLAAQTPDYRARGAVDLVDCVGVPGGDQVGVMGVFVDAIYVEVIPGVRTVVAGTCLAGVEGEVRFC